MSWTCSKLAGQNITSSACVVVLFVPAKIYTVCVRRSSKCDKHWVSRMGARVCPCGMLVRRTYLGTITNQREVNIVDTTKSTTGSMKIQDLVLGNNQVVLSVTAVCVWLLCLSQKVPRLAPCVSMVGRHSPWCCTDRHYQYKHKKRFTDRESSPRMDNCCSSGELWTTWKTGTAAVLQ